MSSLVRKIGVFHLPEARTFDVPQAYAGAAEQIQVPAGDYPVELHRGRYGEPYVCIPMPGTSVFRSFWSHIGACGSNSVDREPRPATHYLQLYSHVIAAMAARGEVTLDADFSAELAEYDSMRWDDGAKAYMECKATMHVLAQQGERVVW